jgi:hypothetical protein
MNNAFTLQDLQSSDALINFDYVKLVNYIQQFLARSDPDALTNIPKWIALAEKRLSLDFKNLGDMVVTQFDVLPTTTPNIPNGILIRKPIGWRDTKSLSVVRSGGGRTPIYSRTYEYLQMYLDELADPFFSATSDKLEFRYYASYDFNYYLLGPYFRLTKYTIELSFFDNFLPLSTTNLTNYWTDQQPRALIYASLIEASAFLQSDDRVANSWIPAYKEIVNSINQEDSGRFVDSNNLREV